MLKTILLSLLLAAPMFAADAPLWTINDPRGDDNGDGTLQYPMSPDFERGDLDLLSLAAYAEGGGTKFVATFARTIRKPERTTIDAIGTSLDQVAHLGFYTFNLDIYIDTDRVAGSGSKATLPGRLATIDPASAWERVVCLTPDPTLARAEMKRLFVRAANRKARAERKRGGISDDLRRTLEANIDQYVFFPTSVRVYGPRIEFFVPNSFLGGPASPKWSYVIAVSGADIVQRTDQQGKLMRSGDSADSLLILPVTTGRPVDRFGGGREDDPLEPPLVDIVVPAGADQKKVLSDYDPQNDVLVQLPGVVPGG
ncbi:MAG TPA: glucodextranase DOMON-like domain-containing protein [Thermoanaerobaculia bacterium]|nr:glucodextranase DOMON-like domain-containing protein [Thermoanaerobaculia bacterium]